MIYSDNEVNKGPDARRYRFGDLTLDVKRHTLVKSGVPVSVELKVFDLLHLLLKNAGDLVSHDQMIAEIWQGRIVSDSAVSACL